MNTLRKLFNFSSNKKGKSSVQLLNKYTVTGALFFTWVMFFDSHSFIDSYKLSKSIDRLEEEKMTYQNQIKQAMLDKEDLEKNKEKYGREKYFMHKDNEDVFIIERSK